MTRIEEIKARLSASSEGPWEYCRGSIRLTSGFGSFDAGIISGPLGSHKAYDLFYTSNRRGFSPALDGAAELVANAPADLEYLLSEVARLLGLLERSADEIERLQGYVNGALGNA